MARRISCTLMAFAGAALLVSPVLLASAAAADVVTPPGACVGSGTWQEGGFTETSTDHDPGDTIKVPRADTVHWKGNIKGFQLGAAGPRRDIEGKVEVETPFGSVKVDDWDGSSIRYANEGEHDYDLPKVLVGIKMKVKGFHKDAGKVTCEGSVNVEVDGSATSNPLAAGGAAGLVVSGAGLVFAGRPVVRKLWAYEDINPG